MGLGETIKLYSGKIVHKTKKKTRSICYRLGLVHESVSRNEMNPYQYWYDTNEDLRRFIDNCYHENKHVLDGKSQLASECKAMFDSQSAFDKLMSISLLETIRVYFPSTNNSEIKP